MLWASLVRNLEWLVEQLPYRRVQAGRMALWVRCRNGRAGEGRATLEVPTDRFDMLLNTYRPCLRQAWVPRVLAARMHLFAEDLGPHAPREPDLFGDLEAGDAATALKWAVIDRHGPVRAPQGRGAAARANLCRPRERVRYLRHTARRVFSDRTGRRAERLLRMG